MLQSFIQNFLKLLCSNLREIDCLQAFIETGVSPIEFSDINFRWCWRNISNFKRLTIDCGTCLISIEELKQIYFILNFSRWLFRFRFGFLVAWFFLKIENVIMCFLAVELALLTICEIRFLAKASRSRIVSTFSMMISFSSLLTLAMLDYKVFISCHVKFERISTLTHDCCSLVCSFIRCELIVQRSNWKNTMQ